MGLTKKSVSDIERKLKNARYVMRVLKECHMVQDFIEYTKSENYKMFKERYIKKHRTSDIWYDYIACGEILGSVNLSYYFRCKHKKEMYNTYALLLAYLALFDEEEYNFYQFCLGKDEWDSPEKYIFKFINYSISETNISDINIVKNWIKYKEVLYGD